MLSVGDCFSYPLLYNQLPQNSVAERKKHYPHSSAHFSGTRRLKRFLGMAYLHVVSAGVTRIPAFNWELSWDWHIQDGFHHMCGVFAGVA